jgi:hypothetical protein
VVDDGLAILEKNFVRAAQVLADELDKKTWSTLKRSPMLISAASRMIDRGFKAQSAIAVQEELANLRTILDALKAGQAPGGSPPAPPPAEPPDDEPPKSEPPRSPWPAFSAAMKACNESPAEKPPETPMIMVNKHEEAEAAVLRVAWMAEIGMGAQDIAASLRYNRPVSVVEEQHLLNVVREMLEWERIHEVAMRTCTQ